MNKTDRHMIEALMTTKNLNYEQARTCLQITGFQSVEKAFNYIQDKDKNGKYTHKLLLSGNICQLCRKSQN
jgi:hypothetical protein